MELIKTIFFFYFLINAIYVLIGFTSVGEFYGPLVENRNLYLFRECDFPIRRLERIFPGYQLGCWLGERTDEE